MSSHSRDCKSTPGDRRSRRAYLERDILLTRYTDEIFAMAEQVQSRELSEDEKQEVERRVRAKAKEFVAGLRRTIEQ